MTLQEACRKGTRILEHNGVEEASLDAWYLLEHVTEISRARYLADAGNAMEPEQEARYFALIEKRAQRIPLQHLTGKQEFMGLEFVVNEHVLIPRQDTEVLVETALEILQDESWLKAVTENEVQGKTLRLLDMCTGSGCILLSLLKLLEEEPSVFWRKTGHVAAECFLVQGTGADISEKALDVARMNAAHLGICAKFLQSDLFSEVSGQYEMIVSNPPYIRTSVIEELQKEVKEHDPFIALDGKEDGLYFYRKIISECGAFLVSGGYLLFEIGHDQGEQVSALMKQAGFCNVTVKKDLAGLDRVVFGVYY